MLSFAAEKHEYLSLPGQDPIDWISGTAIVGLFKNKFAEDQHIKSTKNKMRGPRGKQEPNPWYGMDPLVVKDLWSQNSKRSTDDGTFYHDREERKMLAAGQLPRGGRMIPVHPSIAEPGTGRKLAPVQKLVEGIYPEHFLYLKSAGICGQADICERIGNQINIGDYKTNAKLDLTSYKDWEGMTKKMLDPLAHLDDCNWNHYCLQLSLYMYIALKHNPACVPGTITVYHVKFKPLTVVDEATGVVCPVAGEYGWPVYERDEEGAPIVESVTAMPVPYLKREIESMLKWYTANRHKLPKKAHA